MIRSSQNFIQNKLRNFYEKRTVRSDSVTLGLRNVYIFFSKEGVLFGLLLLITFIAGVNYGNNLVLGLSFYLASIWLISVHLTFSHVAGLEFRLLDITMAEAGQPAWVTIQIINSASKPSRQLILNFDHTDYIEDYVNNHLNQGAIADASTTLNKNSKVYKRKQKELLTSSLSIRLSSIDKSHNVRLPVITSKRGKIILPRLSVSSVYPLGIMRSWAYVYFLSPIWAYPKASEFEWNPQDFLASDDSEYSHFTVKGQNDFDKLDTYQEGESLARVSWQHFARGHGMLTKHFCDAVGHELALNYKDMPASNHEQKLQQLTFVLHSVNASHESFSMSLPNDIGEIGQGQEFVKDCLMRLAKTP